MFGKCKMSQQHNNNVEVPVSNLAQYDESLAKLLKDLDSTELKNLTLNDMLLSRRETIRLLNAPEGNLTEIHPTGQLILEKIEDTIDEKATSILATAITLGLITLKDSPMYRNKRELVLLEEIIERKEQI